MMNKKKIATTTAATFGAALSSMYLAPELQADVIDITWGGGNSTASHPFSSGTFNLGSFDIDQVGTAADFRQYNDLFAPAPGRSMFVNASQMASIALVSVGQTLNASTFSGGVNLGTGSNSTFDGTGTQFVGFKAANGDVGYFKVSFTDNGTIFYSDGKLGTNGMSVRVVPEPGTFGGLALLAIGAAGIRRKRQAA